MKTNILGLRTAIYKVNDLNKAKNWYSKAFKTEPYFEEDFYVGFNIGGFELGLLPDTNSEKKVDSVLCYWGVDDINEAYTHLKGLGAETHEEPTNVGGELMVATVKDPWGNILGLIYNPVFKIDD